MLRYSRYSPCLANDNRRKTQLEPSFTKINPCFERSRIFFMGKFLRYWCKNLIQLNNITHQQTIKLHNECLWRKNYWKDPTRGSPREHTRFIHDIGKEFRKPTLTLRKRKDYHPRIRHLSRNYTFHCRRLAQYDCGELRWGNERFIEIIGNRKRDRLVINSLHSLGRRTGAILVDGRRRYAGNSLPGVRDSLPAFLPCTQVSFFFAFFFKSSNFYIVGVHYVESKVNRRSISFLVISSLPNLETIHLVE